MADLNRAYRAEPALWEVDFRPEGFSWLVGDAREDNVLAYARFSADGARNARLPRELLARRASPLARPLPVGGAWREVLNTDAEFYGGSGVGNLGGVEALEEPLHGRPFSAAADAAAARRRLARAGPLARSAAADGAARVRR